MHENNQIEKGHTIDKALIRKIIIAFNLTLGLMLWFGYWTDYSFEGIYPNFIIPPIIALFAIFTLIFVVRKSDKQLKREYKLACLPSIIGGIAPMLIVLLLIPPFTLGFFFMADEITNEKQIQTIASPDNTRIANVYFRGVGAYDRGMGRIFIRVKYRWLPLVERDLLYISTSYADENTHKYIRWKDNNTIEIIGEPKTEEQIERKVKVGMIKIEPPWPIALPIELIEYLFSK